MHKINLGSCLTNLFIRFPEWPIKNDIRYFLAFNPIVPKYVSDLSPIKGYELYRKLQEGDIVVDAGAFTGDYTIYAARKVGKKGRVIAFEPDPENGMILKRNIEHEKIDNVIIVPKGLWSKNTVLEFRGTDGVRSSLASSEGNTSINVVKLDDELEKMGVNKVDVIKMDIEGAEIEAVKGAIETLRKCKPFLVIASYHQVEGKETRIFLAKFLGELGYNTKSDFTKHLTTYAWK